jgi:hypothetical protein
VKELLLDYENNDVWHLDVSPIFFLISEENSILFFFYYNVNINNDITIIIGK